MPVYVFQTHFECVCEGINLWYVCGVSSHLMFVRGIFVPMAIGEAIVNFYCATASSTLQTFDTYISINTYINQQQEINCSHHEAHASSPPNHGGDSCKRSPQQCC